MKAGPLIVTRLDSTIAFIFMLIQFKLLPYNPLYESIYEKAIAYTDMLEKKEFEKNVAPSP